MARGKRPSPDYQLGTSWAGSSRPSSSTSPTSIPDLLMFVPASSFKVRTSRSLEDFWLAAAFVYPGLGSLRSLSGPPRLTEDARLFLTVFKQKAGLVFNRDVRRSAT